MLLVADVDAERPLGEVDARHVVGQELGAEALGLGAELLHHRRPEDAVRVAGIVLDVARDHQLAAPLDAFDHERAQVRAGCVEGGRVAGRAASDDDQLAYVVRRHVSSNWVIPANRGKTISPDQTTGVASRFLHPSAASPDGVSSTRRSATRTSPARTAFSQTLSRGQYVRHASIVSA